MLTATLAIVFSTAGQAPPMPFLNPIFSDHMVLQRGGPNTIWGWTTPGAAVTVSIEGESSKGVADNDGKWTAKLRPPAVGGPYHIDIDGPQHVVLQDVLVGDVWLCGGQSNMEMGVGQVNDATREIEDAKYPNIRFAMIPHWISFEPNKVVPTAWTVCSPDTIGKGGWGGFSAVGYFFGRELHKKLGVPIGLVEDCWGGTIAEAWISRPSVEKLGDFASSLAAIDAAKSSPGVPYEKQLEAWFVKADPGSTLGTPIVGGGPAKPVPFQSPEYDDRDWKPAPGPGTYEDLGLKDFDGFVWYRGEMILRDAVGSASTLELGPVDDADSTWINGVKVGQMAQWDAPRKYAIPPGTLKAGKNIIAVRVLDTGGPGGFMGPAGDKVLAMGEGVRLPLARGTWRYRVGTAMKDLPPMPQPLGNNPNVATVLHNGMIAPIVPLAVKGAIWYQGESNAGRAYQYRKVMPALIDDWRKQFGVRDMPFFIVQLANFLARAPEPGESEWAELREAQAMTAQKGRRVGLATAVDIGDAADIHPKNKQDVGKRLALSALHIAYGQDLPFSGPIYRSMRVSGGEVRLSFDHCDGGLMAKGGKLAGFSIAGKDKKFVWADARIEGETVVVSSSKVSQPAAVRYGWANNPEITLYSGVGLPAIPFRTDDWPGLTLGRK